LASAENDRLQVIPDPLGIGRIDDIRVVRQAACGSVGRDDKRQRAPHGRREALERGRDLDAGRQGGHRLPGQPRIARRQVARPRPAPRHESHLVAKRRREPVHGLPVRRRHPERHGRGKDGLQARHFFPQCRIRERDVEAVRARRACDVDRKARRQQLHRCPIRELDCHG
jgi:hypothetical protein